MWDRGMVIVVPVWNIFKTKIRSDRQWYGHWRFGPKRLRKITEKNPVCGTMVWPLADWVKSLIEKKWSGLSDSHMASGGLKTFLTKTSMAILRSHSPFFYPFFDLGRQWPYHGPGMWDRGMFIDVPVWNIFKKTWSERPWYGHWRFGPKRLRKKTEKNPVCGIVVWPLADRVKSMIEKKWPGLSDSHMASGGLNFCLIIAMLAQPGLRFFSNCNFDAVIKKQLSLSIFISYKVVNVWKLHTFWGKICRKLLKSVNLRIFSKIPYFYGEIRKCGTADPAVDRGGQNPWPKR